VGTARSRGSRPVVGQAAVRTYRPGASTPIFVRSFTPWYGGGFGFYDPWYSGFGYNHWRYSPYGLGLGVFGAPYGYWDPYYGYGGGYYAGGGQRSERDDDRPSGSIRLRANPSHARVYIDGALVGTVDDFDGLTSHLDLDPGPHQLELRADGYETYTAQVSVRAGRTMTERASLKRIQD
jgi:hypothetical protein